MLSTANTQRPFIGVLPPEPVPPTQTSHSPRQPLPTHDPLNPTPSNPVRHPRALTRSPLENPSEPTPANRTEQSIAAHFASRPTLRAVVAQLLNAQIKHVYPQLAFDISDTSLAVPRSAATAQYDLTPLLDLALDHLANGTELDFTERDGKPCRLFKSSNFTDVRYLDSTTGRSVAPDLQAIELAILGLRANLKTAYAQALSQYWGQPAFAPDADSNASPNHWAWLSDTLNDTLRIAGLKQPGLDAQQRQTLDQVTQYPDPADRQRAAGDDAAQVFVVSSTLSKGEISHQVQSPDLLITRQVDGRTVVLHTSAAGVITPYPSLEAFAVAWERQLAQRFEFDRLSWKCSAPDGNVFDTQAAVILAQQLQHIQAIQLPAHGSVDALEQLFAQAGDPAPWFANTAPLSSPRLEPMKRNMPDWLTRASDAEQFSYQRHALALASSMQRNQGRTFLTDIPDIRTFARQQLDEQLRADGYTADDLEITFQVPVGDMGSGYIEPVRMSLVDMALENLAGLPNGAMSIRVRGAPVDDPHLSQRLKDVISQVDIGRTYPALLNRHLLGTDAQARARETLFVEQVPIQLNMQAMELKLRGQAGLTDQGCRMIEAAMRPGSGPREVDGQSITVRPLAFIRKPGATPDIVENMFLIEPQDSTRGPHILYRPQLTPSLQEFASRDALLKAIQAPGPLQQSILAWLPDDKARAVYGNGGFHTPHIARYGVFNEFDAPETPTPTVLATDGYAAAQALHQDVLNGDLLKHLFTANANSLVTLAQGQSTSNAQSRWASHKQLGWLLFNTLLPILRGPGAMVGWLAQLASVENDIQQIADPGHRDPTAATVDLLLNLAMLLTHSRPASATSRTDHTIPFEQRPDVAVPLARTQEADVSAQTALIHQAPTDTFVEQAGGTFDFAFSSPRRLTAAQQERLNAFSVPAPDTPGAPLSSGATKGLYSIDAQLYARIDRQWFRVAHDTEGVVIIDQHDQTRTGPALASDDQGHWRIDTRPRLRGGMPKTKLKARLENSLRAKEQNDLLYRNSYAELLQHARAHETATAALSGDFGQYELVQKELATLWKLANSEVGEQFSTRYRQQLNIADARLSDLKQKLNDLQSLTRTVLEAGEKTIAIISPKKISGADDLSEYKQDRSQIYESLLRTVGNIKTFQQYLFNESNLRAASGAPMSELFKVAKQGVPHAYDELVEAFEVTYQNRQALWQTKCDVSALFEKWTRDSPFGNKHAQAFLKSRNIKPPAISALADRLSMLVNLKELSIDRTASAQGADNQFQLNRFSATQVIPVNQSFLAQREYQGYSLNERKAALQTIIDTYRQMQSDSVFLYDNHPSMFRAEYHKLFNSHLSGIIAEAEADLSEVIREEQHLIPVSAAQSEKQNKPHNQRVFNTRDKQTLIGTLKPPEQGPGYSFNVIEVVNPETNEPIATYYEHPNEHEWVKVRFGDNQPPQTPQPSSPKPLATYKAQAEKLLEDAANTERTILFQKKKLSDPQRRDTVNPLDWNDMLQDQADKLEQIARQTEASHGKRPEATELVAQWRASASELRKKARQHCADGYKVLPPKPENVDFLWRHGFVDINLVRRDIPTKSGDVFTEYAVRDKGKIDVLWYAHFHYPEKGAPRGSYTAAHLKIPSQRTKTQKDLIREASNHEVERIIRSRIAAPLDEKLFLKL
ncbi:hypothetical protein [Pseudomonas lactucae]|uniref:hypothetical protein n=1 Tax=Pseudomonas lactucae TaxID=2813360 RepID=UPI001CEC72BF|nr:hypothetical protein [Pseudomonas lactucae]